MKAIEKFYKQFTTEKLFKMSTPTSKPAHDEVNAIKIIKSGDKRNNVWGWSALNEVVEKIAIAMASYPDWRCHVN